MIEIEMFIDFSCPLVLIFELEVAFCGAVRHLSFKILHKLIFITIFSFEAEWNEESIIFDYLLPYLIWHLAKVNCSMLSDLVHLELILVLKFLFTILTKPVRIGLSCSDDFLLKSESILLLPGQFRSLLCFFFLRLSLVVKLLILFVKSRLAVLFAKG